MRPFPSNFKRQTENHEINFLATIDALCADRRTCCGSRG